MSNRHAGVSCDSCMRSNFRGDRFKCLLCYDFDLCGDCHDSGRGMGPPPPGEKDHNAQHPMQCVMTKEDYDFSFWGSDTPGSDMIRAVAFTCPYCGKLGLTQTNLLGHITELHYDSNEQVICPVCVATPNGDPNNLRSDLANHVLNDHERRNIRNDESGRVSRRFLNSSPASRHFARRGRLFGGPAGGPTGSAGRRPPQSTEPENISSQQNFDPISDLLGQLGTVRRSNTGYTATLAQLNQLREHLGRRVIRTEGAAPPAGQQQLFAVATENGLRTFLTDDGRQPTRGEGIFEDSSLLSLWREILDDGGGSLSSADYRALLGDLTDRLTPPSTQASKSDQKKAQASEKAAIEQQAPSFLSDLEQTYSNERKNQECENPLLSNSDKAKKSLFASDIISSVLF